MSGGVNQYEALDELDNLDGTQYDPNEAETPEDDITLTDDVEPSSDKSDPADDDLNQQYQKQPEGKPEDQKTEEEKAHDQQQEEEQQELYQTPTGYAVDKKGNIVDPKSGQIIARAGSERRLYEKSNRLQRQIEPLQKELENYKTFVDQGRNLANEIKKHGFKPDELQEYFDTVILYKTNPLEAAKRIVANVASMGYNISDIVGGSVGDAVDMAAIKRMIESNLAPINQQREQEQTQQVNRQELERKLQDFYDQHEYSDVQANVIDNMLGANKSLTPSQAYYELKSFCDRNGFDMSIPLAPQVQERRASAQNQQEQPAQQPRTRRSIPSRSATPAQEVNRGIEEKEMANANSSWDDIIRSTLRN